MNHVLDTLERIKSKLIFAVASGHDFIPVGRIMSVINKITRVLGHVRPMTYEPPYKDEPIQAKVWDALDTAHRELKDLLITQKNAVINVIGEKKWNDFYSLLSDFVVIRNRAFDKEYGPKASLLKTGRKFNVESIR